MDYVRAESALYLDSDLSVTDLLGKEAWQCEKLTFASVHGALLYITDFMSA